jgi:hypothetical protein
VRVQVDSTRLVERGAAHGRNVTLPKKLLALGDEGLLTSSDRAELSLAFANAYTTGYLAAVEDIERSSRGHRRTVPTVDVSVARVPRGKR